MAKGSNQKLKLLQLARIFAEETDEEHGLTMPELIGRLAAADISADRKTLYLDMDELRRFGMDIISVRSGGQTLYRLASRKFELAELKLLVDAVQCSKFITEKKTRTLIGKLEGLVSRHEAQQLHRQVLFSGRVKTMNESIYYNVDKLHTAISAGKQIRFHYFNWNVDREPELRRGGAWYCVSPWQLVWDDENYYLVAYDAGAAKLKHYRVDKMKDLSVAETPREGEEAMRSYDAAAYTRRLFSMFGGESERVTLEGTEEMAGVLIDRFGRDIPMYRLDEEHFRCYVEVAVSQQFLGWIASLGGSVRITAPERVVTEMRQLTARLAAQYSEGGKESCG